MGNKQYGNGIEFLFGDHRSIEKCEELGHFKTAANKARETGDFERAIQNYLKGGYTYLAAKCAEEAGMVDKARELYKETLESYEPMGFLSIALHSAEKLGLEKKVEELARKIIEEYEQANMDRIHFLRLDAAEAY